MLTQCLFAVCMLAVIIVGLLVMTGVIGVEELGDVIERVFLLALGLLIALCVLKGLLLPVLMSWIVALKQMLWWIVMIVVTIIATMLLLRILVSKLEKWLSARGNHNGGEL